MYFHEIFKQFTMPQRSPFSENRKWHMVIFRSCNLKTQPLREWGIDIESKSMWTTLFCQEDCVTLKDKITHWLHSIFEIIECVVFFSPKTLPAITWPSIITLVLMVSLGCIIGLLPGTHPSFILNVICSRSSIFALYFPHLGLPAPCTECSK